MARLFTRSSATNYIRFPVGTIGTMLNGLAGFSIHAWAKFTTFDGASGAFSDRVFSSYINGATVTGLTLAIDSSGGGANHQFFVGARSQGADAFSTGYAAGNLVTGVWESLGGTINIAGDQIINYRNGTANTAAATFGAATYTHGAGGAGDFDYIGGAPTLSVQMLDGAVSELGIWNVILTAGEMTALSKGFSPLLIRPQSLILYTPLIGGFSSAEYDVVGGKIPTFGGTVAQTPGPGIIYPASPQEVRRYGAAAVGGGGSTAHRFFSMF